MRKHTFRGLGAGLLVFFALFASSAASGQTAPYTRTVIVNNVGSDAANGAALLAALSGLSPAPSPTNPWLIKLEGGIYDVGTTPVVLPDFVNLQGSGIHASTLRGSVQPLPTLLVGGLVRPSSHVEIRDLTIQCLSSAQVPSCQAMSIDTASPKLTDLRILSQGSGTENHWGIRLFDSAPTLDRVEVLVNGSGSRNYGIVYGGRSTMNIKRSSASTSNASFSNWTILMRDEPTYGTLSWSSLRAAGGEEAACIRFENAIGGASLLIDSTQMVSVDATKSVGIGDNSFGLSSNPTVFVRGGRIFAQTHSVDLPNAAVNLINTEASGSVTRVNGFNVRVGGSFLSGTGTISAASSLVCAGNFDGGYNFYPSTCPP
ncbi:MAG: hypothetical protein AAGM22_25975 [Acidobacteriota bacterium]